MPTVTDLLEDVTVRMANLKLDDFPPGDGEISPISDGGKDSKRSKPNSQIASRYLAKAGGIMDPLLYLRVNPSSASTTPTDAGSSTPSTVYPSLDEILEAGYENSKLLVESTHQPRRPKQVHQRQPSTQAPARPAAKLPIAVFRFCQIHQVKFIPISVSRTYRSIAFSNGRGKSVPADFDPWELYTEHNSLSHYRLCHSLYFSFTDADGIEGRLVVIVPHTPKRVGQTDVEKLSAVLGMEIKRVSLTGVEKELGFPTFVCPPFGHEFAPKIHATAMEERKRIVTVIDSSLIVEAKTDCVFDLGIVALRIRPAELGRLAKELGWTVIDQLVKLSSVV